MIQLRSIRWKRASDWRDREQCASWLFGMGYRVTPIFGDWWLVSVRLQQ